MFNLFHNSCLFQKLLNFHSVLLTSQKQNNFRKIILNSVKQNYKRVIPTTTCRWCSKNIYTHIAFFAATSVITGSLVPAQFKCIPLKPKWFCRDRNSNLECFDCHRQVVLLPNANIHLPILASSKLVLHSDIRAFHLPFIVDGRHTVHGGLVAFGCRVVQSGDQAIGYGGVVVDKLSEGCKSAFGRHIHLSKKKDTE